MVWEEKTTIEGLPYYWDASSDAITWDKPAELMDAQEKEDEAGEWCWVPHPTNLWQPARVESETPEGKECVTRDGKRIFVPANGIVQDAHLTKGREVKVEFWPVRLSTFLRPVEDLIRIENINKGSIINNIRLCYEKDHLYTWVGAAKTVLISVNPYKQLDLYGPDKIEQYRHRPPNTHLMPHVFDVANDSYNSMLFEGRNQSVLISGESGAGKTVCTKQCLNFLATVAGSEQSMVEEKILAANPVLEAFGNAQTIRNNNSSRFGKWIEVHFDPLQRQIISAKITNYLLEKSRLVHQQKGERNYHVFYQLTGDSEYASKFQLEKPQKYEFLNQSGLYKAHMIDDAEEFEQVKQSLDLIGFSQEEKDFVFSVTAGLLVLGNCSFVPKAEKNSVSGSKLKDEAPMKQAAKLLGFKEADLKRVLSYRSIEVRGTKSTIPLDPEKAKSGKDALAMGIYSRLFDFLVGKINQSLEGREGKFIGILDIFGFEIFEQNSFEQLCINFANEKLQQQFNRTTFKEEEALYVSEQIKFEHIDFIDNQEVLNMIEMKPVGILPLLDDECKLPGGSDKKFMNRMEDAHLGSSDKFQTDKKRRLEDGMNFEINHYAGVVKYNGKNFMLKNTDSLYSDMYTLCQTNHSPYMKQMFPDLGKQQMKSLSFQFRKQLSELMEGLYQTDSRYIRCVKPNAEQKPGSFDSYLVIDQLRYSGVFEAVEIRKHGFPFRFTFAQFACRYACINARDKHYEYTSKDHKELCKEILDTAPQDFSGCVFGKTMVLFKTLEFNTLELLRELALERLIPVMQRVCRGHLAREMLRRCKRLNEILDESTEFGKGSDIEKIDKALAKVDPQLDHFLQLFPGVRPTSEKGTVRHREALQQWIELEESLARLSDLNEITQEDFDLLEAELAKAKGILDVPMTEKQKEVYTDALEQRNYMEVEMTKKTVEENLEHYSELKNFSNIREAADYTKRVKWTRKTYEASMFKWQKSNLPASLTVIGVVEVETALKQAFIKIMMICGQRKMKKGVDEATAVAEVFDLARQSQENADEIWCQLLKMTVENPKEEYLEKIYQLIAVATRVIKPSEELEKFVMAKLMEAPNGKGQNYISTLHATKFEGVYEGEIDLSIGAGAESHPRNRFSLRHANE